MNNTDVYFISSDYVKQTSPIIDDVENSLLTSSIMDAQNIDLQECIGEDLYTYFVTNLSGFTTGDSVETLLGADYYKLFDNYFKPFLKYQTIYYSFYSLFAKITAKGIVNQTSGNSHTADMKILENMRKDYLIKASHYKHSMTTYLSENWSLYPEYTSTCVDCDSPSISGLYLGKNM